MVTVTVGNTEIMDWPFKIAVIATVPTLVAVKIPV